MNRNLWLLALCQGLFLTNNVTFIAINGLVGLRLAPYGWMATLPVMGYVVGGALSTSMVARSQSRFGRRASFQIGLAVAAASAALAAWAVANGSFWWLVVATVVAGYYSANGHLYRFAAAELAQPSYRERAVSMVLAGGLLGAIVGPNLAARTRGLLDTPFVGAYLVLAGVALLAMALMARIDFPPTPVAHSDDTGARSVATLMRQPVFLVAAVSAALGYGVMNLLMAATPLAMQQCGLPFEDAAWVLQWHVIGMFAPGFFTGNLIKRLGTLPVMLIGLVLNLVCIGVALSGQELQQFVVALFLLGVGWNFLFTGSTTLALGAYRPQEKDRAQAAINFGVFAVMAITSFSSGALVTTQGWALLNWISLALVSLTALAIGAMAWHQRRTQ
ncbi:MAG: MFS transporter [Rhodoferax sp.]